MTELETKFMETLKSEAYGGTLFTQDINPKGMDKAQKSGVVSSLVQKKILTVEPEYQQIGLVPEDGDIFEAAWEFRAEHVEELIQRASL